MPPLDWQYNQASLNSEREPRKCRSFLVVRWNQQNVQWKFTITVAYGPMSVTVMEMPAL